MSDLNNTACYIHIPFCDHKCIYCDFYSIITDENFANYLTALKKEIVNSAEVYSEDRIIDTIFFGGGTPSLMSPEYLREVINSVKSKFKVSSNAEITMETNPGTVDEDKLKRFREIGINRISIGIQSFDEDELKFLTRIHDKQTAINTVRNARAAGFNNISIDLIFNLPGQTKEKWRTNLETAFSLPIDHISAYSLILERGTILNKMVLDGKVEMQDDDYDADLYEYTIDFMRKKGFVQYEVSNFCKPGYECRHNLAYWQYRDYLGFGTSAHSFLNAKRWWNYSALTFYMNAINERGDAAAGSELLSKEDMVEEYVMLALRSNGLDTGELNSSYGGGFLNKNEKYLNELIKNGYLVNTDNLFKLTPKGYAVCDEILSNFK